MSMLIALAAATTATPLKPAGRWTVGYNDNDCTLQRTFGDPANPVTFGFKPEPTHISGDMVLVLPGPITNGVSRGKGKVTLEPGGETFDAHWVRAPLTEGRHGIRFNVEHRFWEALKSARIVSFDVGEPQPIAAELGGMPAALEAARACGDDLLRIWGADPARVVSLTDYTDKIVKLFGPDSYPVEAQRLHKQGRVRTLTVIDAKGVPVRCRVVGSSGVRSLDDATCSIIMHGVRVAPDPTSAEGRFVFLPVRWVLPD